ncbi:MAG TPA: hypothetical protein P5061_08670, partial [Mycobacterium sp.]|nr:hypothetical protein [Mycobacterium sp.]
MPAGKTPAGKPDHLPARNGDAAGPAEEPGTSAKLLSYLLETSSRLQGPAIRRYVQRLRRKRPHATPADIVKRIQRTYLVTVIASGAAIGSAAILPGIGTLTALAAVSGETVLFLEATTVFVLAMAEVYGIEATDRDRRRALVLYVLSGEDGKHAVANVLGDGRRHFEQAVFADGLSADSVRQLRTLIGPQWKALLEALVPPLEGWVRADAQQPDAPR